MTAPHITTEQLLQHQDWLFGLVRSLVKDDFTAEDMAQGTMAEALADENAGQINLRAWLSSTARRLTAQNWRSEYRRQRREEKVAISDEAVLKQSTDVTELFHIANQALGDLPENERVVIMLRYMQGWKSEKVANELNIPIDQVYRDSERGLKKLRDQLQTKYGKEWKASCLVILGAPLGRGTASTFGTVAAIAASVAVLIGGAWLSGLFEKTETKEYGFQVAGQTLVTQASSNPDALPLNQRGVQREVLSTPTNSQAAYAFHAIDEFGTSLSGVKVELSFRDLSSYFFPAKRTEITDSAGIAYFQLEPGHEPVGVTATMSGLFHQRLVLPEISRERPTTLRFQKGTIPVSFQVVHGQPHTKLLIQGEDGMRAFCDTDETGLGTLLFPNTGKYDVTLAKALPRKAPVTFDVNSGGSEAPIKVDFPSPIAFTLIAVEASRGEVIEATEFTLAWPMEDQNERKAESQTRSLQGVNGVLVHQAQETDNPDSMVRIHADGYGDVHVTVLEAIESPFEVELHPLTQVRASLQLSDPERHLISAQATYANAQFSLTADGPESTLLSWSDASQEDLVFTNRNQVLLSRPLTGNAFGVYVTATDDFGKVWHSAELVPKDLQGYEPLIPLALLPQEITTFEFLHNPSPDSTYTYQVGLPFFPGRESGLLALSKENIAQFATSPGERVTAFFRDARFFCNLALTLPATPGAPTYSIQFPERTSTLHGKIVDAFERPIVDCFVTAIPMQQILISGPSPVEVGGTGFDLKTRDGILHAEHIFEGEYELEIKFPGHTFYRTVSTENDFVVNAPTLVHYQLQVMDRDSHAPLAGTLNRRRNLGPRLPMRLATGDSSTGQLNTWVDSAEASEGLFLVAKGYQPEFLSNYLHGTSQVVALDPGREGAIRFSEHPLDHDPMAHWTLDAWGEDSDPRHSLLRNFPQGIHFEGAPLEDFLLIERDPGGTKTGRSIKVSADGLILVHTP